MNSTALNSIVNAYDRFLVLLAVLVGIMVMASMIFVVVDVLLRYFLGTPIGWVIEVCEYFLLFTPFLGMAWLVRQLEGHIRIDIIVQALSARSQAFFNCSGSVVVSVALFFAAYHSALSAWSHVVRNVQTPGVYPVPKGYLMFVITLGFTLTAIEFLRKAYQHYEEMHDE